MIGILDLNQTLVMGRCLKESDYLSSILHLFLFLKVSEKSKENSFHMIEISQSVYFWLFQTTSEPWRGLKRGLD